MKIKSKKPRWVRRQEKDKYLKDWHNFFPIWPRRIAEKERMWFETIERKGKLYVDEYDIGRHWDWEYREKKKNDAWATFPNYGIPPMPKIYDVDDKETMSTEEVTKVTDLKDIIYKKYIEPITDHALCGNFLSSGKPLTGDEKKFLNKLWKVYKNGKIPA